MGRAALDLDLVQSALSQQISRLENQLSTRLLQRTSKGVVPTEAGLAFFREAQLTLRHAADLGFVPCTRALKPASRCRPGRRFHRS